MENTTLDQFIEQLQELQKQGKKNLLVKVYDGYWGEYEPLETVSYKKGSFKENKHGNLEENLLGSEEMEFIYIH